MTGYFLSSVRDSKDTLYPVFSYIWGKFLFKKLVFNIALLKNFFLIQHVIMLTQFNGACGTAIAIHSIKAKFDICLNKFLINKEA